PRSVGISLRRPYRSSGWRSERFRCADVAPRRRRTVTPTLSTIEQAKTGQNAYFISVYENPAGAGAEEISASVRTRSPELPYEHAIFRSPDVPTSPFHPLGRGCPPLRQP